MKQFFLKRLLVAATSLFLFPAFLLAQKEEKEKTDKKEVQHITIVRKGNKDEKTVIEINGDKVKINGKDAADDKDVQVHIRENKDVNFYNFKNFHGNENDFSQGDADNDMEMNMNLFSEDENRAMLGVMTEANDKGAEIQSVTKGSAAEKAGLKKGDIITRINDKKVETTDDVTEMIHEHKPGEKVILNILRNGKDEKVTAELGKWKGINMQSMSMPKIRNFNLGNGGQWNIEPSTPEAPVPPNVYNLMQDYGHPKLGLSIQDTDDGNGVQIMNVQDESNADKAGLKEGDIITSIDGKAVKGTEDVTKTIREDRQKISHSFTITRNGKSQTVEVKIPRKLKTADL